MSRRPVRAVAFAVVPVVLWASLFMLLPAGSGGAIEAKKRPQEAEDSKPRLRLLAEPAVGFVPLTAVATAQLSGVDPRDPNFCHAAVTWVRVGPGQTEEDGFRTRQDPACLHGDEQTAADLSFTKTFALARPGSYLIRIEIEGKDGTIIRSGFTKVQALRVH